MNSPRLSYLRFLGISSILVAVAFSLTSLFSQPGNAQFGGSADPPGQCLQPPNYNYYGPCDSGGGEPPPDDEPYCNGGAYWDGDACYCPTGQEWSHAKDRCVDKQSARCTGGGFWYARRQKCITCFGGTFRKDDVCVCPDGQNWSNPRDRCVEAGESDSERAERERAEAHMRAERESAVDHDRAIDVELGESRRVAEEYVSRAISAFGPADRALADRPERQTFTSIEVPSPTIKRQPTIQEWVHANWATAPDYLRDRLRESLRDPGRLKAIIDRNPVAIMRWYEKATALSVSETLVHAFNRLKDPDDVWRLQAATWWNDENHQSWVGDVSEGILIAGSIILSGPGGAAGRVAATRSEHATYLVDKFGKEVADETLRAMLTTRQYNEALAAQMFVGRKYVLRTYSRFGTKQMISEKEVGFFDFLTGQQSILTGQGYGPLINRAAQRAMEAWEKAMKAGKPLDTSKIFPPDEIARKLMYRGVGEGGDWPDHVKRALKARQ